MSSEQLIEALRADSAKSIEELRAKALNDALAIQRSAGEQAAAIREQTLAAMRVRLELERRDILADAVRQGRAEVAGAEAEVARKLHAAAVSELATMRERMLYRGEHLEGLIAELPGKPDIWSRITVNPADENEARRLMPHAEVVTDPAISGGFRAGSADGRVVVDNTLERRFERSWAAMLPEMMKEIHARHSG